jgi:hypothetical protein
MILNTSLLPVLSLANDSAREAILVKNSARLIVAVANSRLSMCNSLADMRKHQFHGEI